MCSFVEFLRAVLKLCPTKNYATFFGPPDILPIIEGFAKESEIATTKFQS